MVKKKIQKSHEKCSGCMLCMLACSLFNFDVFSPEKSFIKLIKNGEHQSFTIAIGEDCKLCGECIRACTYNALWWDNENPRN